MAYRSEIIRALEGPNPEASFGADRNKQNGSVRLLVFRMIMPVDTDLAVWVLVDCEVVHVPSGARRQLLSQCLDYRRGLVKRHQALVLVSDLRVRHV